MHMPPQADPISKAVADNVLGKLATKKSLVRCYDCKLDFTSQIVLDAHLQGARHAKQVSREINIPKCSHSDTFKFKICTLYLV